LTKAWEHDTIFASQLTSISGHRDEEREYRKCRFSDLTVSALPCRRASLPPRFPAAALTLLCLTTLDVSAHAQAASGWLFHVDVVGTPKTTRTNSEGLNGLSATFTAPADATNGITIGSYASGHAGDGASPGSSASCSTSMNLSVKITATWQGSDPAPPSVEIIETGHATASATIPANYGTESVVSNDGLESSDATGVAYTPANTVPPTHLTVKTGSTWSITRSFSATSSSGVNVPASAPQQGYSCGSDASLDSYSVQIHAQPYDYHETNVTNNQDGTLTFYYDWLSTSGSKSDLTTCFIHEYVTYPGPVGTGLFPLPYTMPAPFNGSLNNPTAQPGVGSNGQPATDTNGGMDHQGVPPISPTSPHINGAFTGTQLYEFDDTATGETNTQIPGPDSGPWSIKRSVGTSDGILWYYNLTKAGITVGKPV